MSLDEDPLPAQSARPAHPGQPDRQPGDSRRQQAGAVSTDVPKVTDARTLRALAHPVRIALIEELVMGGAATATELGERIGETPTTCSFHLRQLAKYGFVEEAGGGKGRARPWRLTSIGISFGNTHDDPATELAAGVLSRMVHERQLDRYRTWLESRATYPREWRDAAHDSEYLYYLTAGELKELSQEITDLLMPKYQDRLLDPAQRPVGSVPVELLMFTFPVQLPDTEAGPDSGGEPGSGGAG
jgi:DNA-binding transcriptional ArsR family regulator